MLRQILLIILIHAIIDVNGNGFTDAATKAGAKLLNLNNKWLKGISNFIPNSKVVGFLISGLGGLGALKSFTGEIDERVCNVTLSNHGNRKLVEPTWYLKDGIIHDPLPREISPGDAGVFTFENTAFSTYGTSGMLTYTIEGTDIQIEVLWSVPMLYGPYANRLNIKLAQNEFATPATFQEMYNNDFQEVSNGGHWMKRKLEGIKVHGSMTNNAKASLRVDVFYIV